MQTIFRQQWAERYTFWEAIELLKNRTDTHLVYLGPQEWEATYNHPDYQNLDFGQWFVQNKDFLTSRNNRLTFVDGAANVRNQTVKWFSDQATFVEGWYPTMATMPGCEIIHWPAYWLENCSQYASRFDLFHHVDEFEYTMVCMMHRPHPHRGIMMTELMKRNMHQTELVSWHGHTADHGTAWDSYGIDPILLQGDGEINHSEIILYDRAFCNLVVESTVDAIFFTEKTLRPIMLGKVFLVYGGVGINQKLSDLGFQLFTEVFDYSFDQETDHEKRASMIVDQIAQIRNQDTSDLFRQVEHKVSHNLKWAVNMQETKPTRPKIFELDGIPGGYSVSCKYSDRRSDIQQLLTVAQPN